MLTVTLNPSVDVSTGVAVVEPERKLHCGPSRREAGGGGVNVARVAHVLGADVTASVTVGPGITNRYWRPVAPSRTVRLSRVSAAMGMASVATLCPARRSRSWAPEHPPTRTNAVTSAPRT